MKVINLFAGPGSGKSTTASGLFFEMKIQGYNVELVSEFAKQLTWQERQNVLAKDQLYVTAKQNHKLEMLRDHVDYAITDSPVLLGLAYTEGFYLKGTFVQILPHIFDSYDNINFFINRVKPYNPVGRNQTEAEAKLLDTDIKDILNAHQHHFQEVDGDRDAPTRLMEIIKAGGNNP